MEPLCLAVCSISADGRTVKGFLKRMRGCERGSVERFVGQSFL